MSSLNTAIIKPDPMEMTFYYGDDYNFPIHANLMKMEMTPKNLTISPNSPLQVSLKNLAKKRQELVVQLNSFLFKIQRPRAFKGTKSQIYCIMEPGETLNFRIEMMKETRPGFLESDVLAMANTEGIFTIFHQTTSKKDDSDMTWIGTGSRDSPHNTDKESSDRIIKISVNADFEHGFSEQPLFLESDSELTKKRKQQFDVILKNEKIRIENEEKEKEKADKEKNEKKKRHNCVVM
ncbi:hypothetical protein L5515_009410 [Caenorhabditis briggsae]|uniref:Uncharacterized protein n=2 Tax=Caenorhabditis briggsae TaxID=6238 RepID=A0AAE9JNN5_CAEBR|nr:hypothetical protein L5515_009410 [Caenorhabditis briggsae]